jgi:exosortase/archaeosortase family protein
MGHSSTKSPSLAWLYLLLAIAVVSFSRFFFVDEGILAERILIAAWVTLGCVRMLRQESLGFIGDRRALAALVLATLAAVLTLAVGPIKSLHLYATLGMMVCLAWYYGGRAMMRQTLLLAGGLALLIYPPQLVFSHFQDALLVAVRGLVFPLCKGFAKVTVDPEGLEVAGLTLTIDPPCGGSMLAMTFASVSLVMINCRTTLQRIAIAVTGAVVLSLVINVARILTMVALANAGYAGFALDWGHSFLGRVFMFLGCLVIMTAVEVLGRDAHTPRMPSRLFYENESNREAKSFSNPNAGP